MRVKFLANLRNYTNCSEIDIPVVPKVGDLIRLLSERYGPEFEPTTEGELESEIVIMINGRHAVHLGGIDAPLKDDDVVQIFPLVAGG